MCTSRIARTATGLIAAVALTACATEELSDPASSPATQPSTTVAAGKYDDVTCFLFGRMTGGGGQDVELGGVPVYITRGFTIHCDILLSNNLEINWAGNRWHIDKPLTFAQCSDDPTINPSPPPAPFDTFYGEGYGRLNGVDGAFVQFTFADAGEPSGNGDWAAIRIFDADGNIVLDLPRTPLTNGNIQAHYDQPHGSNVNR